MSIADGLLYDTEDRDVCSQIDAEVCAVKALSVVSQLLQLTRGIPGSLKPTGFQTTLKCSISHPHGSSALHSRILFASTEVMHRLRSGFPLHFNVQNVYQIRTEK